MGERRIVEIFDIPNRFLRSAHLERDFHDPRALDGYILTEPTRKALERIIAGVLPTSGHRAWRITGDFGTGKSSFGLLLAHLLAGRQGKLSRTLANAVDFRAIGFSKKPHLHPLLIVGVREGITTSLARAMLVSIDEMRDGNRLPAELRRIKQLLGSDDLTDTTVMRALAELSTYVVERRIAGGLLLILDELGKLLEHCALNANADVYLLQRLAEAAARSTDRPLVVVGLLHQGFHAYAEQLPTAIQQEWEKVAGRFEEIVFDQPLEHTSIITAGALNVRMDKLPNNAESRARRSMRAALQLGWYGNGIDDRALETRAPRLYPLHAFVLPPLIRFLRRYGQHERSLFGFLLSTEPFGLQNFATRPAGINEWYRLHDLYDYVRATFGHLLGGQSHRSHWLRIASLIDGQRGDDELALQILKTVGILNLLDAEDLLATADVIAGAMDATDTANVRRVEEMIERLRGRNLLYDRGTVGGYCLWPNTSVSLEQAFHDAERAIGPIDRVSSWMVRNLDSRPLVARRHHITSGTMRHFEVRFRRVTELDEAHLAAPEHADGLVLVPLCDTPAEHDAAVTFACSPVVSARAGVLVAVPEPLRNVADAVRMVECWEWVNKNTPALNHDGFAAAEAARQRHAARRKLQRELDGLVGLQGASLASSLRWFHQGNEVVIRSGRQMIERLSLVCDELFAQAPRITNELVNRRVLSSAGTKARQILIERILTSAHLRMLGLDEDRAPPEKSIYLSILKQGGVHQEARGTYSIVEPPPSDPCRLRPALARIHALLTSQPDVRVDIATIAGELRKAPYGVREGVWPLLLAIYIKAHEHELAFYERGSYMIQLGGAEFLRLIKAPTTFEMQLCQVIGVRAEVFDRLLRLLDVSAPLDRKPALLDIVTPLCTFAAGLPEYVLKTSSLSERARAVRGALIGAHEPVKLLFHDLPTACGRQPFAPGDAIDDAIVRGFVRTLRSALDEMRGAYNALQVRNEAALYAAVGIPGVHPGAREALSMRARGIQITVRETRLTAFCLRLADDALPPDRWIDGIASLVASKPPSRWTDGDERLYADEVSNLGDTFQRVEAVVFGKRGSANGSSAIRIMLTRADGTEIAHVIDVTATEEPMVMHLESKIRAILAGSDRLGLAATSRAFWNLLSREPS